MKKKKKVRKKKPELKIAAIAYKLSLIHGCFPFDIIDELLEETCMKISQEEREKLEHYQGYSDSEIANEVMDRILHV